MALPVVSVVVFGLIGATAPCQLSTSVGAMAYAMARSGERRPFVLALAYVAGKMAVYVLLGIVVIVLGVRLQEASIPVIIVARRALGPLMIAAGLALLGAWRFRISLGRAIAGVGTQRRRPDTVGAFLLGVVFAFAFCPTLFWLFFGLTVPLALRSTGGWAFPGLFALGSSLPLLLVVAASSAGFGAFHRLVGGLQRWQRPLRIVAGATPAWTGAMSRRGAALAFDAVAVCASVIASSRMPFAIPGPRALSTLRPGDHRPGESRDYTSEYLLLAETPKDLGHWR